MFAQDAAVPTKNLYQQNPQHPSGAAEAETAAGVIANVTATELATEVVKPAEAASQANEIVNHVRNEAADTMTMPRSARYKTNSTKS